MMVHSGANPISTLQGEDKAIARSIQSFFTHRVFERQRVGSNFVDIYRTSWKAGLGPAPSMSEEQISNLTLRKVQEEVRASYEHIESEHRIGNTGLSFDMFNPHTGSAIEICLGAITKEFHKDVLKAMLDQKTHSLLFFFREYGYGKQGNVLGQKWFAQPAQRELISLIGIHKLLVIPISLVLDERGPSVVPSTQGRISTQTILRDAIPKGLDMILEVARLMRMGKEYSEACNRVAANRKIALQTVRDKCGRRLGLTAKDFVHKLTDGSLKDLLAKKYPKQTAIISSIL